MATEDAGTDTTLEPIRFGRAVCGTLAAAERREWWIANGRGGYAAGTIAGTLTRRYHGLLIAPVDPPLGRRLVFAKADATLLDGADPYPLFANRWGGGQIAPAGQLGIESFYLDHSVPVWMFCLAGRRIEARIWMEPGENTTWLGWLPASRGRGYGVACAARDPARQQPRPSRRDLGGRVPTDAVGNRRHAVRAGRHALHASAACRGWPDHAAAHLVSQFRAADGGGAGSRRGDAHLCVGEATLTLRPGAWCGIVASLQPPMPTAIRNDIAAALARRLAHDRQVLAAAALPTAPAWVNRLVLAADAFVIARPLPEVPDGRSVIAGYPWFGDWGRDTMISLPGLTLATGRPDVALRILQTFARFVSQGMLPNVFPGAGDTPDYNTADASLWFFEAWRAYIAHDR